MTNFRHQVALLLMPFGIFLCLLYAILLWMGMEKIDDDIRQKLVEHHHQELLHHYALYGTLANTGDLSIVEVFLVGKDPIPERYLTLSVGFHELYKENTHLQIGVFNDGPLGGMKYIIRHIETGKEELMFDQILFRKTGFLFIAFIALLGTLLSWLLAKNIAAPLQLVAQRIRHVQRGDTPFQPLQRGDELGAISDAFEQTYAQLHARIEREKQFSRYASHELRTPVAVVKTSLSLWKEGETLTDTQRKAALQEKIYQRIQDANSQMETVIQTFLALGSERSDWLSTETIDLAAVFRHQLSQYERNHCHSNLSIDLVSPQELLIVKNRQAVEIIVSNLLRNAFAYCASSLKITLTPNYFAIANDIDTLKLETAEHVGFGLSIVSDLCKRLGWTFTYGARVKHQFEVLVRLE